MTQFYSDYKLIATVDISTSLKEPGLMARKIWQLLFNEYRAGGGDLSYMDSILCDLKFLEKYITEEWKGNKEFIRYWNFDRSYTELQDFDLQGYKVEMNNETIKLYKTVV